MIFQIFSNEVFIVILMATIAAFGGHLIVNAIVSHWQNSIANKNEKIKNLYEYREIAQWIGIAERALYIFALYYGYAEFIAVWLVFKTAVHWRAWASEGEDKISNAEARAVFNIYVLGTAMSLLVTVMVLLIFSVSY